MHWPLGSSMHSSGEMYLRRRNDRLNDTQKTYAAQAAFFSNGKVLKSRRLGTITPTLWQHCSMKIRTRQRGKLSTELHVSQPSVVRILKASCYHPYKLRVAQELTDEDRSHRRVFLPKLNFNFWKMILDHFTSFSLLTKPTFTWTGQWIVITFVIGLTILQNGTANNRCTVPEFLSGELYGKVASLALSSLKTTSMVPIIWRCCRNISFPISVRRTYRSKNSSSIEVV